MDCYRWNGRPVRPGLPEEDVYWPEPIPPAPSSLEQALSLLERSIEEGHALRLEIVCPAHAEAREVHLVGGAVRPARGAHEVAFVRPVPDDRGRRDVRRPLDRRLVGGQVRDRNVRDLHPDEERIGSRIPVGGPGLRSGPDLVRRIHGQWREGHLVRGRVVPRSVL